ncbi:hypothetical protein RUM44_011558 [Polyplax serrata]|uniref:Uncharacterized protein n=1 Tax=Polyplax serrata TaxID=468196 RepID=A0ABR1AQG1_POLSC
MEDDGDDDDELKKKFIKALEEERSKITCLQHMFFTVVRRGFKGFLLYSPGTGYMRGFWVPVPVRIRNLQCRPSNVTEIPNTYCKSLANDLAERIDYQGDYRKYLGKDLTEKHLTKRELKPEKERDAT